MTLGDTSPRRWYDPKAKPLENWSAAGVGSIQQARIAGTSRVLSVALAEHGCLMRPKVIRWRNMNKSLLGLWGRLSGEDPATFSIEAEDATDDQILTGQGLDPVWLATTTISQAAIQATQAITAAYGADAPKRTLNQMSFYFTREIEDLERTFGL